MVWDANWCARAPKRCITEIRRLQRMPGERITGMDSGGGSSQDRRRFTRLADRVAKALEGRMDTSMSAHPVEEKHPQRKMAEFWGSTPAWGALGVMCGALVSQISLKIIFVIFWAVIVGEFIRIRVSSDRTTRYVLNTVVAVVLATALWVGWTVFPKTKEPLSLDAQASVIAERLLSRLHPSVTNNIYQNPPPKPHLAHFNVGFAGEKNNVSNTLTTEEPPMVIGLARKVSPNLPPLPIPSRLVTIRLMGNATGDVTAKNVHVFTKICEGCDYIVVPEGFMHPDVWPNSQTDIDKVFGDIPVGPQLFVGEFVIALPMAGNRVELDMAYTCDNCAPLAENHKRLAIKLTPKKLLRSQAF